MNIPAHVFNLSWLSADGQRFLDMGQYPTRDKADAAIPGALAELLAQCREDSEREAIKAGTWGVSSTEE